MRSARTGKANGGSIVATERVDQPVQLAQQIADMFQLRQSEGRAKSLQNALLARSVAAQPSRRQDIEFIFLAATPQQAQQIKPTLNFQYAGDVPVYATSHVFSASGDVNQYNDMNGVRFCETPWLLDANDPLRHQVTAHGHKRPVASVACTPWVSTPTAWRRAWAS